MNLANSFSAFTIVTLITACGGSGGGSSNANNNPSPTNSSSSSASSKPTDTAGLIFGDSLNSSWGHFSAFEWSVVKNTGNNYDDGQGQNVVQWKIVDSASAGHQSVVEVAFNTTDNSWAQFEVTPDPAKDITSYATGKLSFDINVQTWGEAYDKDKGGAIFEVRAECGWPCSSHAYLFVVNDFNTWAHIEVSIAEMINDGLDPTNVDRAFIIKPTAKNINGLRIQLDNIQWSKGTVPAVKKKIVYEEHFNTYGNDGWNFVSMNGMPPLATYTPTYGLLISPSVINSSYYNDWDLEKQLPAIINFNHKKINVQIKANQQISNFGTLQLALTDSNLHKALADELPLNQLTVDAWNRIQIAVDDTLFAKEANFDLSQVTQIGIIYHSYGSPHLDNNNWGSINIDEIIITE